MPAKVVDGRKMAEGILESISKKVMLLDEKPCLAIVLVGDDPASKVYTKRKHEACKKVGILSRQILLPSDAKQSEILECIKQLNEDPKVDAVLVQLPLPKGIDENAVLEAIAKEKDVDGFHPENFGKAALGLEGIAPCTPAGVIYMLQSEGVSLQGKHAVVIGRSRIVGKPLAMMLLNKGATVTVCHSKTTDLGSLVKSADIVCSAVGKPKLVTESMVKEGAVVIDIGISRQEDGLVGDVDFESVSKKASLITPVPGGVGPMTIAMLMKNALFCYAKRRGKGVLVGGLF